MSEGKFYSESGKLTKNQLSGILIRVPKLQSWASHITTAERLIQPAVDQQSNFRMGSALNRAARFERWETRK
jgi:hypothetical protein